MYTYYQGHSAEHLPEILFNKHSECHGLFQGIECHASFALVKFDKGICDNCCSLLFAHRCMEQAMCWPMLATGMLASDILIVSFTSEYL